MRQAVPVCGKAQDALAADRSHEAAWHVTEIRPSTVDCHIQMQRVRNQLIGAARDAYPSEACGIITADGQVWSTRNLADNIRTRMMGDVVRPEFVMSPEDVMVVWPYAAAIWHSHPNGRLDPSEVDRHWHPDNGASGRPLGMVIVTCDDALVAVPW